MSTAREMARAAAAEVVHQPHHTDWVAMSGAMVDAASDIWEPIARDLLAKLALVTFLTGGHPSDYPIYNHYRELLGDPPDTEPVAMAKDYSAKIQYLIDWLDEVGQLEEHCFTFPDGDTWFSAEHT